MKAERIQFVAKVVASVAMVAFYSIEGIIYAVKLAK